MFILYMPTRKHTRFRINCSKVWKHPKLCHEFSIIGWTIPLNHTESDWMTKINIKKRGTFKKKLKKKLWKISPGNSGNKRFWRIFLRISHADVIHNCIKFMKTQMSSDRKIHLCASKSAHSHIKTTNTCHSQSSTVPVFLSAELCNYFCPEVDGLPLLSF